MVSASIGQRVAIARRRRGLSQAVLAGLVGRSESWLSQVERGIRSVDRLPVLIRLAEVLHIEVETLLGRPWEYAPNGGLLPDELDATKQYLHGYRHLFPATDRAASPAELEGLVRSGHVAYQAADYAGAAQMLPAVLAQADDLSRAARPNAPATVSAYVSAYVLAAKLLRKLGALDLAMIASDRAASAARDGDLDAERALTGYQIVESLLRADQIEDAESLALSFAGTYETRVRPDEPALLAGVGALWLLAGVIAARRADRHEAMNRIGRAERLADLLGRDANYGWTAFGPTNVAIHRVSVAAEMGEAGDALAAAQQVDIDALPPGLKGRRAQLHIDLGWAYAQCRRDADATLHLLEAEKIAPQLLRYNPLVREHLREMLTRAKGGTTALHDLAIRAGVLD